MVVCSLSYDSFPQIKIFYKIAIYRKILNCNSCIVIRIILSDFCQYTALLYILIKSPTNF